MDILGADFYAAVDQIRNRLGKNAIVIQLPIGKEDEFKGIIDLFEMQAYYYEGKDGAEVIVKPIPAEYEDILTRYFGDYMTEVPEFDSHDYLFYENGPHGGAHGHYDKLGIIFYSHGDQ